MSLLKNKKPGYILLLTMIIVSSIFLLVISVVIKNRLVNSTANTISLKHEQNILFTSAISIVKSLLSFDELNKNNKKLKHENNSKNEINIKNTEKNSKKDEKTLPLLFFNFYWKQCNKWLNYKFINNKYNLDGIISIYLTIEDGKFPLKKLYAEYEKEINKESEKNETKNEEKNNIINEDNNKEKNNLNIDKNLKNNIFLEKIKKIFNELEEKSNIFKKIISYKKKKNDKNELDKNSLIIKMISKYFKKGSKKSPSILQDAFNEEFLKNEHIYGNLNNLEKSKKEYGIQDIFSVSTNHCSLWYLAPGLIEFLDKKPIKLDDESRKKILDAGKKYFEKADNNEIKLDDLWNNLYANTFNIPYPKEFFEIDKTQKIFTSDINLPDCFSALIKIEIINSILFGIVLFEKNKKYVKSNEDNNSQNQEYLIKSIYILPFE